MKEILTRTAEETTDFGHRLGKVIAPGTSISLTGDLGAGKTTFVQGLAKGIGVPDTYYITSPTFTIANEYPGKDFRLVHLDLYRLGDIEELSFIGFEDFLDKISVIVVEWPNLLRETGFCFDLEIRMDFTPDFHRNIAISASGKIGSDLLGKLFS